MNLKPIDPEPGTRERILDTAERLFAGRGFAGTSVRDITDAAEANLGAVNYYFRSKQNLYAEVFSRRAALLRGPVVAAAQEAADLASQNPEQAFRILGRACLAPHENRDASLCLLGLFAREVIETCLPPRLFAREFLAPTIDVITSVVQQARPDLPEATARACAHSFFAQLMHIVKRFRVAVKPGGPMLEHAVRFTVAAVMNMEAVAPTRSHGRMQRKQS
jgi:TetR/AcrR family transcriptional regulator, regulator of cefoperazone and chloramphenicol sensitivity